MFSLSLLSFTEICLTLVNKYHPPKSLVLIINYDDKNNNKKETKRARKFPLYLYCISREVTYGIFLHVVGFY